MFVEHDRWRDGRSKARKTPWHSASWWVSIAGVCGILAVLVAIAAWQFPNFEISEGRGDRGPSSENRPSGQQPHDQAKSTNPVGPTQPPSAPTTAKVGTYPVNRKIYDDGANTVTVASLVVSENSQLKVVLKYQSHSTTPWRLTCPSPDADLQSSHLALSNGERVYPVNSFCKTEHPGQTFSVQPGGGFDSWAIYAAVPPPNTWFTLNWYSFDKVEGLMLEGA